MHRQVVWAQTLCLAVALAACAAPKPLPIGPAPAPAQAQAGAKSDTTPKPPKPKIRPFKEVITDRAKADSGLFIVFTQADSTFYEIPDAMLGRDMLLVSRMARTATNIGYGGEEINDGVVRWSRQADRILLRSVSFLNVADDSLPIARAVEAANFEPIIASLPVLAYNKDSSGVVVDITKLYSGDVALFGLDRG